MNYLKYIFKKEGMLPLHLCLIVTYKCNARCKSCFVWKDPKKGKELATEEYKKIGSSVGRLLWLQVGGGEPFLRKDLAEICISFDARNISIPTNALMPHKIYSDLKTILTRGKMDLLQLSISLDAIGEKHDDLRGIKDNFKKVLETNEIVKLLKKRFKNFSVSVNTVISKENEDDIEDIAEFVRDEMNVDYHSFEFLRGNPRDKNMQLPSPEKIDLIISIIKKTIKHYDFYEGLGTSKKAIQSAKLISQDIIRDILTNKKRVIPCYAGRLNAFIDAYGDVLPCELLEYRFGNLRDYDFDFKRLWTEPKNKKIRSFIEKRCFCTHSCIMLTNILFNPRFYSKIFGGMIYLSVPRLQRNKDDTNE